jgi:FixJ family two-component response regulator
MGAKSTIFFVDDDPAVKDLLRVLLESADHTVQTYDSGREFLADHKGGNGARVVRDLDLPAMSELEVLEALACEPPSASDRPVSHWSQQELGDEAMKRGIVDRISQRSVGRFLKSI